MIDVGKFAVVVKSAGLNSSMWSNPMEAPLRPRPSREGCAMRDAGVPGQEIFGRDR